MFLNMLDKCQCCIQNDLPCVKTDESPFREECIPNVLKKSGDSKKPSSKTSTATKTATATKTSTDAYTQGNITVTGGAGKGSTQVTIGLPGGSLANRSKKASKASGKKK